MQFVTRFAVDLYQALRECDGNLFFSPYSVSAALAMARAGAVGETAAQIDQVFHFDADAGSAHRALTMALEPHQRPGHDGNGRETWEPAYTLEIANALFAQEGYRFLAAFLKELQVVHRAPLERLDFSRSEAARERINGWVEEHTQGKIKDILPPRMPTPGTVMTIANAIYFKANWEDQFEESETRNKQFWAPGGPTTAWLMCLTGSFAYAETETVQVAELPYKGGDLSMVVVLPRERAGLPGVEASLSVAALEGWLGAFKPREVAIEMPRFTFEAFLRLEDQLPDLGMPLAFDGSQADFSAMSDEAEGLFIGAILHKAFISIDEAGTEATASTLDTMFGASFPTAPPTPIPFVVNHPFLFMIRHRTTGCVLFLGRVQIP